MDDVTHPGSASTKRPVALIVALVLAILAAGAVGAYAQWLAQERAHLQTQLASEERKVLDLGGQLPRAGVSVQEKDAALASREVALADATQPELPVRVSFRPAWMGQGMVASFRNVGSQQLTLMVEFRDSSLRSSRDFAIVGEAGGTPEVGHPKEWRGIWGQGVGGRATAF